MQDSNFQKLLKIKNIYLPKKLFKIKEELFCHFLTALYHLHMVVYVIQEILSKITLDNFRYHVHNYVE